MRLLVVGLMLVLAVPLRAQDSTIVIDPNAPPSDSVVRGGPPPEVITELIAMYNDSGTTRLQGDVTLPAGSRLEGRLALYRGSLRVAGRVTGSIAVANGTLYLLPGAAVEGEILVVGGRLIRSEQVTHMGPERVYWDAAPVLRTGDGLLALRERRRPLGEIATAKTTFQTGKLRTTISLGTGGTYNRIEGLPVLLGPQFEVRPSTSSLVRLDLRGILRTVGESADLRSDFGYVARLDLRFGNKKGFGFGGRLYSEVEPIEDQPLSASESGWAAFLLQRDYRDYFEGEGVSGLAYVQSRALRLEFSLGWDNQTSVRATDPWSLFRNSDRWRRNPLVDDGHYFTTGLEGVYDTRNERDRPTTGWMIRTRYEHITSDDIAPVALPPVVRPSPSTGGGYATDRLLIDARRYSRLTPKVQVNTRLRADGWLAGERLPVQERVSLGGTDLLPGFDFRAFNCAPTGYIDPALTALCDRSIAAQIEVRTRVTLNLGYRIPDREGKGTGRFLGIEEADLVFLSDAGKAWLAGDGPGKVPADRIPVLNEWEADLGVGLDAGEIAAYLAKSLTSSESVKFVVRLQRRF